MRVNLKGFGTSSSNSEMKFTRMIQIRLMQPKIRPCQIIKRTPMIILDQNRILPSPICHHPKMRSLRMRLETLVIWIRGTKCYQSFTCFSSTARWSFIWSFSSAPWAIWNDSSSLSTKSPTSNKENYQPLRAADSIRWRGGPSLSTDMLSIMRTILWAEAESKELQRSDTYKNTRIVSRNWSKRKVLKPWFTKEKWIRKHLKMV